MLALRGCLRVATTSTQSTQRQLFWCRLLPTCALLQRLRCSSLTQTLLASRAPASNVRGSTAQSQARLLVPIAGARRFFRDRRCGLDDQVGASAKSSAQKACQSMATTRRGESIRQFKAMVAYAGPAFPKLAVLPTCVCSSVPLQVVQLKLASRIASRGSYGLEEGQIYPTRRPE